MEKEKYVPLQTVKEEIFNSVVHGIGIILSIISLVVLLYYSTITGTTLHIVSSSLYGSSLVILYLVSTLYHAITHRKVKKVFRRLDHISIFLLIAGTYMPITLVALKGTWGWTLFGIECGFCLIGITFKAIFGPKYGFVSVLFYLLMGWIAIIAIKPILDAISIKGFMWILAGGVFYTLGVPFYALDRKVPFFHSIWHIFVLFGSICHFFMVFYYIIPLNLI